MPKKKRRTTKKTPQKNVKKPDVTLLYDDALPVRLKLSGMQAPSHARISTNKTSVQPSPYVVKLDREQDHSAISVPKPQQITFAPALPHEEEEEETLGLDLYDLIEQFRESDSNHVPPRTQDCPVQTELPEEPSLASAQSDDVLDFFDLAREAQDANTQDVAEVVVEESLIVEPTASTSRIRFTTRVRQSIANLPSLLPQETRMRAIASFVLLSFMVVVPLHAMQGIMEAQQYESTLETTGRQALADLEGGLTALQTDRYDVASATFARASDRFADAEATLDDMHVLITALVNIIPETDRTYDSVAGLVVAGKELSKAAEQLTLAADDITSASSVDLVTKLHLLDTYVQSALPHVQEAQHALADVDPSLVPADYQNNISHLTETVPRLATAMEEFTQFIQALTMILGDGEKVSYLAVFQNNTELRATGGFMGSFAEIDLLNGALDDLSVPEGGTYDLQGQLSSFVSPPEPLSLINPRWEFHDSNWFPHFPDSAQKMMEFYEDAGGPTTDGVIAINATIVPTLLEVTGPIGMPNYGRTIDSENFLFETQKIVELEYEQYQTDDARAEDAPKQFIGDLMNVLLEDLQDADLEQLLGFADVFATALYERDVQLYFKDNDIQRQIEQLGWSGSITQAPMDYLMVVNSNIGGQKTDTIIGQQIDIDVEIQPDGRIINTVTVEKEHHGLKGALFNGVNNVDYIRFYVPRGSTLLSADGFEIPQKDLFETYDGTLSRDESLALLVTNQEKDFTTGTDIWEESGKTVFGNWMQTAPGEVETITISYELPFTLETGSSSFFAAAKQQLGLKHLQDYSLYVQKQPGVQSRETSVLLSVPYTMNALWSSHDHSQGVTFNNDQDTFIQTLFEFGN
jgi:hypothetical protein